MSLRIEERSAVKVNIFSPIVLLIGMVSTLLWRFLKFDTNVETSMVFSELYFRFDNGESF